jgi:hypothetical protein
MKQTTVEWLKSQLETYGSPSELSIDWETLDELIEQAKMMEKEQIIDSFVNGYTNLDNKKTAEQYYNQIFKSE